MRDHHRTIRIGFAALVIGVLGTGTTSHAQSAVTVSPAKGQSAAQMDKDKADCTSIAQQSAASTAPPPAAPQRGGALRGAAKGAAVGAATSNARGGAAYDRAPDAAQDEYRKNQAGKGAAAGAAIGAGQQRRANAQASQQQAAGGQQAVDSAFRSCLMGRGYNVQ